MEKQHLRERLQELHAELQNADSVDPSSRELLHNVMDDILGLLERSEEEEERDHAASLVERLREAVGEFEDSHPHLTEAAGRVVDALARMGI